MRITLDQFQTDFVTGLDSVVVGAQWLQDVLRERDRLNNEVKTLIKVKELQKQQISNLQDIVLSFELSDKNIYILDTLA